MSEFLTFRRMVTPILIQLLFWLGLLGVIAFAIYLMTVEGQTALGVLVLVLGPLAVRVYAELLIVVFRIHSSLRQLVMLSREEARQQPLAATPPGPGPATTQPSPETPPSPGPPSSPETPPSGPPSA